MKALISVLFTIHFYSEFNLLDSWKGTFSMVLGLMWMYLSFLPNWILINTKLEMCLVFF